MPSAACRLEWKVKGRQCARLWLRYRRLLPKIRSIASAHTTFKQTNSIMPQERSIATMMIFENYASQKVQECGVLGDLIRYRNPGEVTQEAGVKIIPSLNRPPHWSNVLHATSCGATIFGISRQPQLTYKILFAIYHELSELLLCAVLGLHVSSAAT